MVTNFRKHLKNSTEAADSLPLESILQRFFPELIQLSKTTKPFDQQGADYIAQFPSAPDIGIDIKLRSSDPQTWGQDDLAIEIWSSIEHRITGYRGTRTDYILWLYPTTGRAVLIPFIPFQRRLVQKREIIVRALKQHTQATTGKAGNLYHSQHAYVPTWLFADLIQQASFNPNTISTNAALYECSKQPRRDPCLHRLPPREAEQQLF